MKEETTDEKNYRKAKLKLEHPYSSVKDDIRNSTLPIIDSALKTIQKSKKVTDTKGTYDNHLSMSDNPMIQTVAIAMLINHYSYQKDKIEILESNSDDVVQVLIPMTKQGADSVYFVANYNLTV
ncbi:signal peptide protein, partial [Streptococcus iniae IUSA1]